MLAHEKLKVWKDTIELTAASKKLFDQLENARSFGLRDQMLRSLVSVSSNIAEGSGSGSNRNFARYLNIALGSIAEFQSQIEVCRVWGLIDHEDYISHRIKLKSIAFRIQKLKTHLLNQ